MSVPSPLSNPNIVPDPYPVYADLAERDPVHWCEGLDGWAVMRYADCAAVLKDTRFKADRMDEVLMAKFEGHLVPADNIYSRFTKNVMMYQDAPKHTSLRRSTHAAFSRSAHEHYSEVIKQVAFDLVATIPEGPGEIDAVADLAAKLPVNAAVRAFGVPEEDLGAVLPHVDALMTYWSGPQSQPIPFDILLKHLEELHTYSAELLQGQRGTVQPGTVIARLAETLPASDDITPDQIVHQLVLLLIALFAPTTPGSTSSGMLAFATHPEQIDGFRRNAAHADNVANEVVRFNASNQFTWRLASTTIELANRKIEAGQNVAVFLGSANRDPRMFDRPGEFDLSRANSGKHLSFGTGPHACLGRQIANLELKWFFVALFDRFPKIALAGDPVWNANLEFRSLRTLPLRIG